MATAVGGLYVIQNAKWVLHAAKAAEVTVPSLQAIQLPLGFTVNEVQAVELGIPIDKTFGSGSTYDPINFDANFVKRDPTRTELVTAAINQTPIIDSRFYADNCDFVALDLINDSAGSYRAGSQSAPGGGKQEIMTQNLTVLPAGMSIMFDIHYNGDTLATVANVGPGTPATITDSAALFVTNGIVAGMTLILDYIDGEDPFYVKVESVVAGLITLEEGVGDEATIPAFSFTSLLGVIHAANPVLLDTTGAACG